MLYIFQFTSLKYNLYKIKVRYLMVITIFYKDPSIQKKKDFVFNAIVTVFFFLQDLCLKIKFLWPWRLLANANHLNRLIVEIAFTFTQRLCSVNENSRQSSFYAMLIRCGPEKMHKNITINNYSLIIYYHSDNIIIRSIFSNIK